MFKMGYMIIIAENDRHTRKNLGDLLSENGYSVKAVSLNTRLKGVIKRYAPRLVVVGVTLEEEDPSLQLLRSFIEKGVFTGKKLLLVIQPSLTSTSRKKKKEVIQIECDGFCDKPVEIMDFVAQVRSLAGEGS